jgi:hypothetical protein
MAPLPLGTPPLGTLPLTASGTGPFPLRGPMKVSRGGPKFDHSDQALFHRAV